MKYRSFSKNTVTDHLGEQVATGTYNCEVELPQFGWVSYTVNPADGARVNVALLDAFVRDGLIEEWRNAD